MANVEEIPTSEIEKDIADTEAEIPQLEREAEGFRLLGDRWSQMRADSRVNGIRERREFIVKLQGILQKRAARTDSKGEAKEGK